MKRFLLLGGFVAICFLGCVTSYQPSSPGLIIPGPGYTEQSLGDLWFEVQVHGTGWTSKERMRKIALVRAAELSISLGYAHFSIFLEESTKEWSVGLSSYGSGLYPSPQSRPLQRLIFQLSNNPEDADAEEILRTLGPEVGYNQ